MSAAALAPVTHRHEISAKVSDGRRNATRKPSVVGERAITPSIPHTPVILSAASSPRSGADAESKDPYTLDRTIAGSRRFPNNDCSGKEQRYYFTTTLTS